MLQSGQGLGPNAFPGNKPEDNFCAVVRVMGEHFPHRLPGNQDLAAAGGDLDADVGDGGQVIGCRFVRLTGGFVNGSVCVLHLLGQPGVVLGLLDGAFLIVCISQHDWLSWGRLRFPAHSCTETLD